MCVFNNVGRWIKAMNIYRSKTKIVPLCSIFGLNTIMVSFCTLAGVLYGRYRLPYALNFVSFKKRSLCPTQRANFRAKTGADWGRRGPGC